MAISVVLSFMAIVAALQLLFDVYINLALARFIRLRGYSNLLIRAIWTTSAIMFALSLFAMFRRLASGMTNSFDLTLQFAVWLWYAPKLPVVIVLLVKDIIRLLGWMRRAAFRRPKQKARETQTNAVEATTWSRRDFLQKTGLAIAGSPYIIVANGMFNTLYDFQTTEIKLPVYGLSRALEGLRIIQISDIHAGSFGSSRPMREVGRLIREQRGDIIVITGDFVNSSPSELPTIYGELEDLKAPLGVYGIFGNHDHFMSPSQHAALSAALRKTPIDLLVNENRVLSIDGAQLAIAGTDNTGFNQKFARLDLALAKIPDEASTILLAHDPTFWDKEVRAKTRVDAMLSGHTHGGQVAFAIPGITISAAQLVYKQWAGLYREGMQALYVNCGVGTVGPPLRIGVPPEISVFTLTRA